MTNLTHQWFLGLAEYYATASKDPSTRVGCVIVNEDRVPVAMGFNGFPMGVADTPERLNDRPTKIALTIHAEQNAFNFKVGSVKGCTLYSTFAPCYEKCAPLIIQNRIKTVVFYTSDNPRWREGQAKAVDLFVEAGIEVIGIDPATREISFTS